MPDKFSVNGRTSTVEMRADLALPVGSLSCGRSQVICSWVLGDVLNQRTKLVGQAVVFVLAFAAIGAGCGGNSTAPTSPPVAGLTITITSSGVSPKNLQVSPGAQVTFINNDSRNHEMDSDPHPEHTDCPAINQVGPIVPGQTKQTGNLNTVRTCGFHDHGDAGNPLWQGKITIQ